MFKTERCIVAFEDNSRNDEMYKSMLNQLKLKGYSNKTQKSYLNHIRIFISFIDKDISLVRAEDIRKYILYLLDDNKVSHSYANQAISAIKFLFYEVYKMDIAVCDLPRPKKERKLPDVLSQDEVFRILEALDYQKHKAILFLVYSAGLRVGEVVRLKIQDIDSKRMLIHIIQGKGLKDRYTVLSQVCLE